LHWKTVQQEGLKSNRSHITTSCKRYRDRVCRSVLAALLPAMLLMLLAVCRTAQCQPTPFKFPKVNPAHTHTRLLLENALRYAGAAELMTDPTSGYPFEGWNQEPKRGLYLRQFTQLTAIGEWLELLANITAGYADNPYLSRVEAQKQLALSTDSLLQDQQDPLLSAKGLLVNFIGFENSQRLPPLSEILEKQQFVDAFGPQTAEALWQGMREKGWIIPRLNGREADIKRSADYGKDNFDGPLAPYADDAMKARILALMDRRVVQIVFGDNANLSASVAKAIGALLHPECKDDPAIAGLRRRLETFLENQKPGYEHLFDTKTGTFTFGWDATRDRLFGWEDGAGNYVVGHMNYLVNEFRGPLLFVTLRYGFPTEAVANAGFKIKPYRRQAGDDMYTLATWEGSAFQSFGLTLFMQELDNPAWRRILGDTVDIELDYAARNNLPGFLSEAYSGQGVEYTGRIGIPDIAIAEEARITTAPSLYSLGAASQIAPDRIEHFLGTNWPVISRLFTEHGPWEGFDTKSGTAIKYQTTAHTLALLLGTIGSAPDAMWRYLEGKGLYDKLLAWYAAGDAMDFLAPEVQIVSWTSDGSPIKLSRDQHSFRIEGRPLQNGRVTLTVPQAGGVNMSGGELHIRYRAKVPLDHALITLQKVASGPYVPQQFANQIYVRFGATPEKEKEISIPLPATPGLAGTRGLVIAFGRDNEPAPVDVTITALKFVPYQKEENACVKNSRYISRSMPKDPIRDRSVHFRQGCQAKGR